MACKIAYAQNDGSQFVPDGVLPLSPVPVSPFQPSTFLSGPSMTIPDDDSVHIAFSDSTGLRYATRARDSDPFQVAHNPVDNRAAHSMRDLSIAVGSGGQIGISYMFNTVVGFQLIYAQKTPAKWVLDTADPAPLPVGPLGVFLQQGTNSLLIDANGVPHIAYCDGSLRLRHGTWTAAGQGFWAGQAYGFGEIVDQAGQPSPAKILLDKNNVLHIAYQARVPAGTTELRLATRTVSGWVTGTVDPSMNSGWAISAAIDPFGQPHIAYGNGAFVLKHTFAVDLIRIPFPRKKRPINVPQRPT